MSSWKKTDSKHIWHPFSPLKSGGEILNIKKGRGAYLYTHDGRKVLDLISSWWVTIHGHGNKRIAKAIGKQARRLEQVIFAGFTHRPALRLVERLKTVLPADQSKFFFSDDGSTATEVAIKLAIQYWHNHGKARKKIIAIDGAYHGDTFGAMSVGGKSVFNAPFQEHLFEVDFIPLPEGDGSEAIEKMNQLATEDVAGFIFEPLVQGAGGMRMYAAEVLDQLIAIARSKDIICIADEVMTGFGRTGKTFACDYLTQKPDIFCLSKGLTGGFLPMSITTVNDRVAGAFDDTVKEKVFFHGHSYTANPIACAAANESFKILMEQETQDQLRMIAKAHAGFAKQVQGHPLLADVRQQGTILALEMKATDGGGYMSDIKNVIYEYFMSRDLLLRPLGNVIYLLPPYVITEEELQSTYQEIDGFLRYLQQS